MGYFVGLIITLAVFSIPLIAIILSHKRKTQINRIRELELQKEVLELEIEKQNITIKLLERQNRELDKIINV